MNRRKVDFKAGVAIVMLEVLIAFALVFALLNTITAARAQPAPPPLPPLGWVFTRYTVCPEPAVCPMVFVSVAADGLNVRAAPEGPPIMALVNGTPLYVLDRVGQWTLVAAACDLTPTFLWSWTAPVPLNRCWVYY